MQFDEFETKEKPHYALRKLNIGVASVLLSTSIFLCQTKLQKVQAATITDPEKTEVESKQNNNENKQTPDIVPDEPNNNENDKPQLATYSTKKSAKTRLAAKKNDVANNSDVTSNANINNLNNDTKSTDNSINTTNNGQSNDIVPTDPNVSNENDDSIANAVVPEQNTTDPNNNDQANSDIADVTDSKQLKPKSLARKTGKEDLKNTLVKATYDYDTDTIDFYGNSSDNKIFTNFRLFGVGIEYISSAKHIVFHEKLSYLASAKNLFDGCGNLIDITGLDKLDVSEVTDMSNMFSWCTSLKELDLSSFNTSKVTDMSYMFDNCSSLTKLNLSNFDNSQVTDMSNMFLDCRSLTELNLSNFNTNQVTNMESMFDDCRSLTGLDLSSFDTKLVTDMSGMFHRCESLSQLDLHNFNTSQVTNMARMFDTCSSLKELDLSNFDTSNVTNMEGLFDSCENLIKINLSSFNTSKVTRMSYMFTDCESLVLLDLHNFDTSQVKAMNQMFMKCVKLKNLDISNFTINDSISVFEFFEEDNKLQILHLGNKTKLADGMGLVLHNWQNVGTGTLSKPEGSRKWSTPDLIKNYNPATDADTYVADIYIGTVKFHYLDQDNHNAPIPDMPDYSTIEIADIDNNKELNNNLAELKKKGYILVDDPLSKLVTGDDFNADENFIFKHLCQENTKINFKQNYVIHYQDENKQKLADDYTEQRSVKTPITVSGTYDFVTHQFVDDSDHPITVTAFDDTTLTRKNPVITGYVTANSRTDFVPTNTDNDNSVLLKKPTSFWNKLLSQVPNHDSNDGETWSIQDTFELPDWEQTVTYNKVGNFVLVNSKNEPLPNMAKVPYENDPNDAAKVLASKNLPKVAGYNTPEDGIMPLDPTKDTLVNYALTNKTTIAFLDQDNNNQPIENIAAIIHSYDIKAPIGQDSDTKTKIATILQELADKHYLLAVDPLAQEVLATEGEQNLHYVFKHDTKTGADTIMHTRTIYTKDDQGQDLADPIVQSASFKRSKTTDLVTNKVTYGDWDNASQTYAAISADQLARKGYTHTPQTIASETVTPTSQDETITVTYNPISHTYTIIYYDQVTGKELARDLIALNEGQKTKYEPSAQVKQLLNSGYEDTENKIPTEITMPYDSSDQTQKINLAHKTNIIKPGGINPITGKPIADMTRTITRTIKYVGTKDPIADTVQSVTFNRDATVDNVTGEVTYGAWDNSLLAYGTVAVAKVPGYQADKTEIPNVNVTPDSKNVIETVTYTPIKHTVTIVYRDLDDNDKIVMQDQVSGNEGDIIAYDKAGKLAELQKQHYVHDPKGDTLPEELKVAYDSTDVIYYIGLRHDSSKVNQGDKNPVTGDPIDGLVKTVTRTIKYQDQVGKTITQGIDGSAIKEIVQSITFHRDAIVDQVTGKVTYGAWQETKAAFAAIKAPDIYGYQVADEQKQVPSQDVTADSDNIVTVLTYTKQELKAEYHVIYRDLDDNKDLYTDTLTGTEGETIAYDPSSKIQELIAKGYLHDKASDTLPQEIKVPYHAKGEDYIIGFKHKIVTYKPGDKNPLTGKVDDSNLVKTVTKTIKYQGAPNSIPDNVQNVKFSRTANVDLAKGTITYNDWDKKDYTFKDVTTPTVAGYLPDKDKSNGQTVTPDSQDITETITYAKKQENKTVTHFIDQDNNQQEISGIEPVTSSNKVGEAIVKPEQVADIIKQLLDKGYEIVKDPFAGNTLAIAGSQDADYLFKHKVTKTTKTVTRKETVQFVDSNGNKLANDNIQNVAFVTEVITDLVTGKITTNDDTQTKLTKAVAAPVIKGYLADQKEIASQNITSGKDLTYKVTYQKVGQIVPVDEQGKEISGQAVSYENDPTDATKIKQIQLAPVISGYDTKTRTLTPTDPTKDTLVTYTKKTSQTNGNNSNNQDNLPDAPSDNINDSDLSDITNAPDPKPIKPELVNKHKTGNKQGLANNHAGQDTNTHLNSSRNLDSANGQNALAKQNDNNSNALSTNEAANKALKKQSASILPQTGHDINTDQAIMLLGLSLALLTLGGTLKPKKRE